MPNFIEIEVTLWTDGRMSGRLSKVDLNDRLASLTLNPLISVAILRTLS